MYWQGGLAMVIYLYYWDKSFGGWLSRYEEHVGVLDWVLESPNGIQDQVVDCQVGVDCEYWIFADNRDTSCGTEDNWVIDSFVVGDQTNPMQGK
jgi:hypothetical protein